jgi:ATP-dependent Zn protease
MCGEKPAYLTIVARGDHGGYMQHASNEDKGIYTRREIMHKIRTSLGGRAAELVYYGAEDGVSTGASGDLYSATRLAKSMMCRYGMDESVGLSYIDPTESSSTADLVRERVNAILKEELDAAVKTIDENRAAIDAMVEALMDKNHLKETEIDGIFSKTVKTK